MSKGWWNDFICMNMLNIHETMMKQRKFFETVKCELNGF